MYDKNARRSEHSTNSCMKKTRTDYLHENGVAERKQILLVEDERELREVLALGLRRARYAVDVAATVTEARQLIEVHSYALVITDWMLPDGNGIDLADRALEHHAKTLIISGYLFGLPAGAARRHRLLRKPFSIEDLAAAVQNRMKTHTVNRK